MANGKANVDKQAVMTPSELFLPSPEVIAAAHIKEYEQLYQRSVRDRVGFWEEQAAELEWFKKWDKALDASKAPFYKWFAGGKTNIVHNAIDRHLKTWRKNKLALLWEGEPGDVRSFSYYDLNREVCKLASVLKSMGVKKGEIVTIYMPQIPELVFAMLACAKIGAGHSVVYAGFSIEALAERIHNAQSRLLITADGGWRRGRSRNLKETANKAMARTPSIHACITVRRTGEEVYMESGRDYWYHDLMEMPLASPYCDTEEMDAEDTLFILYTSGTTGSPKGLLHTHGGYSVYTATTHKYVFDLKEEDRWWCAADPGWITGHSYIVYAPLINGVTTLMYEGAPNYPYPDRWWCMIEEYGVSILYTSPTAIRGLMRFGEAWPNRHDLSSLRLLGSVGEPINPEAWRWYHRVIGKNRCPIMDTWWQTECGGIMISPLPITPLKPGSVTKPFFGNEVAVVDDRGKEVPPGQEGKLVIKNPWPGMARTVYGDPKRYVDIYWEEFRRQGWYKTGDAARIDQDGYIWIIGRIDDLIKVSGYPLGAAEVENALTSHPAVLEAAVIPLPHQVKGNGIHTFIILVNGVEESKELEQDIKEHVSRVMGPIARPETVTFVPVLPKTRSGKIMRRVLKARALDQDLGDLSSLEEERWQWLT
jgi:acetyl-CoA synthetase